MLAFHEICLLDNFHIMSDPIFWRKTDFLREISTCTISSISSMSSVKFTLIIISGTCQNRTGASPLENRFSEHRKKNKCPDQYADLHSLITGPLSFISTIYISL